jgi:hypothetical protein
MFAAYVAAPGAIFTAYKTYQELKKSQIEKQKEQLLKRIEFTLDQHRRLFDDEVLYSVLSLIDADDEKLAQKDMWDSKRKFITFFEEIALLVKSEQIDKNVAYYMFGYYAKCAKEGKNFQVGIHLDEKYWGLFFNFADESNKFLDECEENPDLIKTLKF